MATGAVVVGRKTFDYAVRWNGDHHGVPIFVPTRGNAAGAALRLGQLRARRRRERDAPGQGGRRRRGRDGPRRQPRAVVLRAGLLDELEIHLIPVLLGEGRRLFGAPRGAVELEPTRVLDAPGVTHLRFRVKA